MNDQFPKRKNIRLKNFDYSSKGAYFITICVQNRQPLLSEIVMSNSETVHEPMNINAVGEGLAPPESKQQRYPQVRLTPIGQVAKAQLLAVEDRFSNVAIDEYVFMPDHIHAIVVLRKNAGGSRPSPTLMDVVRVYKSLTSRLCKQQFGVDKLFQRSFVEHVIRDREDYETRGRYIRENPMRWLYEKDQ